MEIAIAVAAALAIIFGISITVASHYHKNSLIVWFTYLTIIFALLGPFLYWQKREWAKAEAAIPKIEPHAPIATPTHSPEAKSTPDPTPKPEKPPKVVGSVSSQFTKPRPNTEPFYFADLTLKWTDYTEDEFYDVIWRWHYKPPNNTPRDIRPFCPECQYPVELNYRLIFPQRSPIYTEDVVHLKLKCPYHPQVYRAEHIPNMQLDDFSKIKALIQERLENDSWREVVSAKRGDSSGFGAY
jgi:hypothetical protein